MQEPGSDCHDFFSRDKRPLKKVNGTTSAKRKNNIRRQRVRSENRHVQSPTNNKIGHLSRYPMATVPRPIDQRRAKSDLNQEKLSPIKKLFRRSKNQLHKSSNNGKDREKLYRPKLNRSKIAPASTLKDIVTGKNISVASHQTNDLAISLPGNSTEILKRPDIFQALTLANVVATVFSVIVLTSFAESNRILIKANTFSNNEMKVMMERNSRHTLGKCISTFEVLDLKVNQNEATLRKLNTSFINSSNKYEELLFQYKSGSLKSEADQKQLFKSMSENLTQMFAILQKDTSESYQLASSRLHDIENNNNFVNTELSILTRHMSENDLKTIDLKENYENLRHRADEHRTKIETLTNSIDLVQSNLQNDVTNLQQLFHKNIEESESLYQNVTNLRNTFSNARDNLDNITNRILINEIASERMQEKISNSTNKTEACNVLIRAFTDELDFLVGNQKSFEEELKNLSQKQESYKISNIGKLEELDEKFISFKNLNEKSGKFNQEKLTNLSKMLVSFKSNLDMIDEETKLTIINANKNRKSVEQSIEKWTQKFESDIKSSDKKITDLDDKCDELSKEFMVNSNLFNKSLGDLLGKSELLQQEQMNICSIVSNATSNINTLEENCAKRDQLLADMKDKNKSHNFKVTLLEIFMNQSIDELQTTSGNLMNDMQRLTNNLDLAKANNSEIKEIENKLTFLSEMIASDIKVLENQSSIVSHKIENMELRIDDIETVNTADIYSLNQTLKKLEKLDHLINNRTRELKREIKSWALTELSKFKNLIANVEVLNKTVFQINDSIVEREVKSEHGQEESNEMFDSFQERIRDIEKKLKELTESESKMKELQLLEEQRKQMEKWKNLEQKYENMTKSTSIAHKADNNLNTDFEKFNKNDLTIMNMIENLVNKTDILVNDVKNIEESNIQVNDIKTMTESCRKSILNLTESFEKDKNNRTFQIDLLASYISELQNKTSHSSREYQNFQKKVRKENDLLDILEKNVSDMSQAFNFFQNETNFFLSDVVKDFEIRLKDIKDDKHQIQNDNLEDKMVSLALVVETIEISVDEVKTSVSKLSEQYENQADIIKQFDDSHNENIEVTHDILRSIEDRVNKLENSTEIRDFLKNSNLNISQLSSKIKEKDEILKSINDRLRRWENCSSENLNATKRNFSEIEKQLQSLNNLMTNDELVHQLNNSIEDVERKLQDKFEIKMEKTMQNLSHIARHSDQKIENLNETISSKLAILQDSKTFSKKNIKDLDLRMDELQNHINDSGVSMKALEESINTQKDITNKLSNLHDNELSLKREIDSHEARINEIQHKVDDTDTSMKSCQLAVKKVDEFEKDLKFLQNDQNNFSVKVGAEMSQLAEKFGNTSTQAKYAIKSFDASINQVQKQLNDTKTLAESCHISKNIINKTKQELQLIKVDQNNFANRMKNELTDLSGKLGEASDQFVLKLSKVESRCTDNVQQLREKFDERLNSLDEELKNISNLSAKHDTDMKNIARQKNFTENINQLSKKLTSVEIKMKSNLTVITQQILDLDTYQKNLFEFANEIDDSVKNALKRIEDLHSKTEESVRFHEEIDSLKDNIEKEIQDIFEDENIKMRITTLEEVQASQFRILLAIESATANMKTQMNNIQTRFEERIS